MGSRFGKKVFTTIILSDTDYDITDALATVSAMKTALALGSIYKTFDSNGGDYMLQKESKIEAQVGDVDNQDYPEILYKVTANVVGLDTVADNSARADLETWSKSGTYHAYIFDDNGEATVCYHIPDAKFRAIPNLTGNDKEVFNIEITETKADSIDHLVIAAS